MTAPAVHVAERAIRATLYEPAAVVRCHRARHRDICTVDEEGEGWATRLIAYVARDERGRLRVTWDRRDFALDGPDR